MHRYQGTRWLRLPADSVWSIVIKRLGGQSWEVGGQWSRAMLKCHPNILQDRRVRALGMWMCILRAPTSWRLLYYRFWFCLWYESGCAIRSQTSLTKPCPKAPPHMKGIWAARLVFTLSLFVLKVSEHPQAQLVLVVVIVKVQCIGGFRCTTIPSLSALQKKYTNYWFDWFWDDVSWYNRLWSSQVGRRTLR